MRVLLLLALLLSATLAGCTSDKDPDGPGGGDGSGDGGSDGAGDGGDGDGGGDGGGDGSSPGANGRYVGTPVSESQDVALSLSDTGPVPVPTGFCNGVTNQCYEYKVTVKEEGNVSKDTKALQATVALSWGIDQNDSDVAFFDEDGDELDSDFGVPPATSATLQGKVKDGEYTVVVYAYQVVADTFQLDVTFA